jgi:signal transduction histidine kinase/CheY-like chemotaxis protein
MSGQPLLTVELRLEQDIVLARQRARQVAALLGFDTQDQTRITTAVSELARNAIQYAHGGRVEFLVADDQPPQLLIRVTDPGPGIANLKEVMSGRYRSSTGMGQGIIGTRRLMDAFDVVSDASGTRITIGKHLPPHAPAPTVENLRRMVDELARQPPGDSPIQEIQQQNQELLQALALVRSQKEELAQVNQELEETNRGVVALYAELDERADYLQRANEIKSRFLSDMTHEFRTPLNSILSLCHLLLQQLDGPLTDEQEKQVSYIRSSADSLSELVDDLLDLAKAEAGKIVVHPMEFRVEDLFGALRGMLRPLLAQNSGISLVFDDAADVPPLHTDESKVSQILRNFISNAIKYTERGEVRVSARPGAGDTIIFEVADTGIGIAAEDQERIFEEFSQINSRLQRQVKGTGLGLPLARRLAQLLGGSVRLKSEVGVGSSFYAILPTHFTGAAEGLLASPARPELDPTRWPVLVVEDNPETLFVYQKYLERTVYQLLPAQSLGEARQWLRQVRPVALILDILLEGEHTWDFLPELRDNEQTRDLPVFVVTVVENEARALSLGANGFHLKPVERAWLLEQLNRAAGVVDRILIIDDEEIGRYLLRGLLVELGHGVLEADGGAEGLRLAREHKPAAIMLDMAMPDMDGFAVLEQLKADPELRAIPVLIHTSMHLSDADRHRLHLADAIVSKHSRSRVEALDGLRTALARVLPSEPPDLARLANE